ncbi:uncharacterized protein LOC126687578 [Mercurialis annua]|uniref:uncharacterized protein LOC126687578 n=1 Tax=Mercurialis annua TaxID=3986 RepID=UPI00215F46A6|nr:uncharacterized protein LOC126687578 [Mercurialis annua]
MIKREYTVQEGREDCIRWRLNSSGKFSIKSAWEHFNMQHDVVSWWRILWSSGNIPKHSFISWLAIRQKLRTREKLKRWGCVESDVCVLCNKEFTLGGGNAPSSARKQRGKSMLAKIRRAVFCCTVYNIWKARNRVIFQNERVDAEVIYYWIRQEVLLKLFSFRCNSTSFLSLYQKWQVCSLSD